MTLDSLVAALRAVPTLCERSLRPYSEPDDDEDADACADHGQPDYPALAAAARGWIKEQLTNLDNTVCPGGADWVGSEGGAYADVAQRLGL